MSESGWKSLWFALKEAAAVLLVSAFLALAYVLLFVV